MNDLNSIEELKHINDTLVIDNAISLIRIKALTSLVLQMCDELLPKEQAMNAKDNFYHTLKTESNDLSALRELLNNPSRLTPALFEFQTYLDHELKHLKDS